MKEIKNLKISIIGAARSGIAAAKLAKKFGAIPFISDMAVKEEVKSEIQKLGIEFEFGQHTEKIFDCDFIITSPGVPDESKILQLAKKNILIISEVEFASWFTNRPIVAITGTNGKSTTTALTEFIFRNAGINAKAAGNIGLAFSEVVNSSEMYDLYVLEISSFQIDRIIEFKPNVGTILNITPDHLDRYHNNFEEYISSKFNLLKNMTGKDLFIRNADDINVSSRKITSNIKIQDFSLLRKVQNGCYYENNSIKIIEDGLEKEIINKNELFIKGEHNIANAMSGILIAKYFNLSDELIRDGLKKFRGLVHRCEFVRELNGVKYINDSKATNVNSTYFAINSYDEPIVLILGGREYNNDYSLILESVKKKVKAIVAIGESKLKIKNYFQSFVNVILSDSFEEAINKCKELAETGDIVLFSPACKSFDMFKNFEHRGDEFKRIVGELK